MSARWWERIVGLNKELEGKGQGIKGNVHPSAVIYNPEKVLIEEGVEVEALAVIDARRGFIHIGKGTIVKAGANLRGPLLIGPECRLGGEVAHSIFKGYSNKAHYGFIGHSYIGEWVNLGAGTTNSNLKNNYGSVKVWSEGKIVDTGQQFLGCYIDDFVKTGIGTLINTGTVIGFGANVIGGQVTPKHIPNFQWSEKEKYRLDDFLKAAETMMRRRGRGMGEEDRGRIREIYERCG
jgi:UDP-N-acetylglucosamine diphosphorylase/glucosamine-1-phosphate N-acetyltransferase